MVPLLAVNIFDDDTQFERFGSVILRYLHDLSCGDHNHKRHAHLANRQPKRARPKSDILLDLQFSNTALIPRLLGKIPNLLRFGDDASARRSPVTPFVLHDYIVMHERTRMVPQQLLPDYGQIASLSGRMFAPEILGIRVLRAPYL